MTHYELFVNSLAVYFRCDFLNTFCSSIVTTTSKFEYNIVDFGLRNS